MKIDDLAQKVVEAMLDAGFQPYTAWAEYYIVYRPIVSTHNRLGSTEFSYVAMNEFDKYIEQRYADNEISYGHYRRFKRGIERITQLKSTGKVEWSSKATENRLTEYYERILDEIVQREGLEKKVSCRTWGHAKRYFLWLLKEGHCDLSTVTPDVIRGYMVCCSHRMKGSSLGETKNALKRTYIYLAEGGLASDSYKNLFTFHIPATRQILPPMPQDEAAAILSVIDRGTSIGKRDYAIILLGIVMGLRGVDISRLKMSDVDWRSGEIQVMLSKTEHPLSLPLTTDVGEALRDYILNGRPKNNSDAIFLRHYAPITPFLSGSIIDRKSVV